MNKYKAHPWHGIDPGTNVPEEVTAFIEIVPTDTVKYEMDKTSGYLTVDRPQKFSNVVPTLYGFIPRTYCGPKTAEYDAKKLDGYWAREMATHWIFAFFANGLSRTEIFYYTPFQLEAYD